MSKCDEWQRRLRFDLARASGFERPGIIRKALTEARQLVKAGQSRKDVLDIVEAAAREHEIKSIKPPSSAGFFRNLPDDDGPRAA